MAQDGSNEAALAAPAVSQLPTRTQLAAPAPSPAQGAVEVRFDLAGAERRPVALEVFSVTGRRVKRVLATDLPGGRYGLTWRGDDENGEVVGAGVYFVKLNAGPVTQVRKVVLVR